MILGTCSFICQGPSGSATRPLLRDGGEEEFREYPTVGPEVKNTSSAKDGVPDRLRCRTIQKEVS